jgi:hypothetical protein
MLRTTSAPPKRWHPPHHHSPLYTPDAPVPCLLRGGVRAVPPLEVREPAPQKTKNRTIQSKKRGAIVSDMTDRRASTN